MQRGEETWQVQWTGDQGCSDLPVGDLQSHPPELQAHKKEDGSKEMGEVGSAGRWDEDSGQRELIDDD